MSEITFAGPGRKELPTIIQLGQMSELYVSGLGHTDGIDSERPMAVSVLTNVARL